ncbi:hypothetical protein E1A91_D12G211400v1 [Gossypium mustelinum]|uniref:Uncharacterized protein n=1 Tax=Gossypium mustelinum TaxID=34275 RepID=A0A5D2SG37_GOSMU|nr:hypothetical protein E1A91_D12G211400v1 [Gossypium mustelinum]
MESSKIYGGIEECHSSESGWTMYIGSPIHGGDDSGDGHSEKADDEGPSHKGHRGTTTLYFKHDEEEEEEEDEDERNFFSGKKDRKSKEKKHKVGLMKNKQNKQVPLKTKTSFI